MSLQGVESSKTSYKLAALPKNRLGDASCLHKVHTYIPVVPTVTRASRLQPLLSQDFCKPRKHGWSDGEAGALAH
jgi:hypothetical protein